MRDKGLLALLPPKISPRGIPQPPKQQRYLLSPLVGGKIRKPLFLHFDTFEAKKVIRVKFVFEKAAMNYSGNGTDLDDVDGRLNVTPSTLVRRDRDFYVVVASILIASGVVPNLFIVVQILR